MCSHDAQRAYATNAAHKMLNPVVVSAASRMSGDSAWTQEMFGAFLSLHDMPPANQMKDCLGRARKAVAGFKQAGLEVQPGSGVLIPLLHMLLPDTAKSAASMLATLV